MSSSHPAGSKQLHTTSLDERQDLIKMLAQPWKGQGLLNFGVIGVLSGSSQHWQAGRPQAPQQPLCLQRPNYSACAPSGGLSASLHSLSVPASQTQAHLHIQCNTPPCCPEWLTTRVLLDFCLPSGTQTLPRTHLCKHVTLIPSTGKGTQSLHPSPTIALGMTTEVSMKFCPSSSPSPGPSPSPCI